MKSPLVVAIVVVVCILGFLTIYSQVGIGDTAAGPAPPSSSGGYGDESSSSAGGYGAPSPTPSGGYGAPAAGGYGAPPSK